MRSRLLPWLVAVFALAFALPAAASEMWVELGPATASQPNFTTLARYASLTAKTCPAIQLDSRKRTMSRRPATGAFTALVCEAVIPPSTRAARIEGHSLPLPSWTRKAHPLIAVVGDTGCRIKRGGEDPSAAAGAKWNIQNCASPEDWPFQDVAKNAAALHPDLVIHVGDYLYRETACAGVKGCPAGPTGDTLETWEADFFTPAQALLLAAPWVFVRGNHEDCGRAGDGYFTLLDPRSVPACRTYTEPYLIRPNAGPPLAVLDTNPALDPPCKAADQVCQKLFAAQTGDYTRAFRAISGWNLEGAWMITHRPVWSVKNAAGGGLQVLNAVEEASWNLERPAGIDLILAGHTHIFEAIGFDESTRRPVQLIVGNSGTQLVPPVAFDRSDPSVREAAIKQFEKVQDFGFTTLVPNADGWTARAFDRTGRLDTACAISAGKPSCEKMKK